MSTLAIEQDGQLADPVRTVKPIRDRIRQARDHRKQFEPTWQSNMAFAAGQHWYVWDPKARVQRRIQDVDPRYRRRELYSVDLITEYRTTVLGELGSDDDRPELLLEHEDVAGEDFQAQVNRALGYAWEFEVNADEALAEADRLCVDLGTSAIRCRFDPTVGPVKGEMPYMNGKPIMDPAQAMQMLAQGQPGPAPGVTMNNVQEGRICWEPLSAFHLLVPPGVTHERYFPWECVVRPTLLSDVVAEFGDVAKQLDEDTDIASSLGVAATSAAGGQLSAIGEARETRLRDHVWLFTYFERPTAKQPQGRVFHFAGNDLKLLKAEDQLPYLAPDGTYRSGISYFHYLRVTGRFWSRALVENLKDGQRAYNKRATQENEIIDRGMPVVFRRRGSTAEKQTDSPMEVIDLEQTEQAPTVFNGVGPGPWMRESKEQIRVDMEHASGVRGPSLGENPQNVDTYSQLARLIEADVVKRQPMMRERKQTIGELVEDTVYDMRTYWGAEKQVMLAGDEDRVEAEVFNATKIPTFFIVKPAKGTAKPRSQAAELTKIEQLWKAALESQVVGMNAQAWVEWYKNSLEAGEALELPGLGADDQTEKARLENHLMLQGADVPTAYYDPIELHLPLHREAQITAELSGDPGAWQRIEAHVQRHLVDAQRNAMMAAQQAGPPQPGPGPAAPSPIGGPR